MKLPTLHILFAKKKISKRLFFRMRLLLKRGKVERKRADPDDNWEIESFNLDVFTDLECWRFFRFHRNDICRLKKALKIPDFVSTSQFDLVTGIEGLCIVLRRLAYPNRWIDLRRIFARSHGALSRIFYRTLRLIDRSSDVLSSWNQTWLEEEDFSLCAGAIAAKGGVIPNVFGFIDGTARKICRPRYHQQIMYSGHKRIHCTKWQAVILPHGNRFVILSDSLTD